MNDDKTEQLARDYPLIFQKSGDFEFSIGDGWYNIVETILFLCSYQAESIAQCLAAEQAKEFPDQTVVDKWEKRLAYEIEMLPTLVQVKEKFGSLRFYVNGGTDAMHHYITFAEAMSGRTCEVCGSPGTSRTGGWIKTLCDQHHAENMTNTEIK